jgi:hypothetical protein
MRVQSETLAEETFARSAPGVANFGTRGRGDRLRTKLVMSHQINRDVTDAYLSTPALFDQLREAQRTVSDVIIRRAGQDPDERLTRLLLAAVVSPIASPEYSVASRNQARHPIE